MERNGQKVCPFEKQALANIAQDGDWNQNWKGKAMTYLESAQGVLITKDRAYHLVVKEHWYDIRYASNRLYLWACRPSMLQRWIKVVLVCALR
jgi:hypothetical protein